VFERLTRRRHRVCVHRIRVGSGSSWTVRLDARLKPSHDIVGGSRRRADNGGAFQQIAT